MLVRPSGEGFASGVVVPGRGEFLGVHQSQPLERPAPHLRSDEALGRFTGLSVLLVGLTAGYVMRSSPSRSALRPRARPAVASALLTAPPGGGSKVGGGGDDGGDGEPDEFLRLLSPAEQASIIDDWSARARIYKMTDDPALRAVHTERLAEIEALRDFDTSKRGHTGARMMLGLNRSDKFVAVASAEVSKCSGLIVTGICVYPAELNSSESTVSLCMVHALHLLANAIEVPLEIRLPGDFSMIQ